MSIYVETSALAKRYVNERASSRFEAFLLQQQDELVISPLTSTELQSVLARRLRLKELDAAAVDRVQHLFAADLAHAVWAIEPFPQQAFAEAGRLIRELGLPLATLDALHLGSALLLGCSAFATADRQLARAAQGCALVTHDFSSETP